MNKTSRIDGILIMEVDKPYKMAVNGNYEDRKKIIAKDINSKAESVAFDLEQYFDSALFNLQEKSDGRSVKEENNTDFFDKDSPSDSEIKKQSIGLEMLIRMSKGKLSEMLKTFEGIITAGLICMDGGIVMPLSTWIELKKEDKLKIMFYYCSFFDNPLQRLQAINTEMERLNGQGDLFVTGTL